MPLEFDKVDQYELLEVSSIISEALKIAENQTSDVVSPEHVFVQAVQMLRARNFVPRVPQGIALPGLGFNG